MVRKRSDNSNYTAREARENLFSLEEAEWKRVLSYAHRIGGWLRNHSGEDVVHEAVERLLLAGKGEGRKRGRVWPRSMNAVPMLMKVCDSVVHELADSDRRVTERGAGQAATSVDPENDPPSHHPDPADEAEWNNLSQYIYVSIVQDGDDARVLDSRIRGQTPAEACQDLGMERDKYDAVWKRLQYRFKSYPFGE